MEFNLYHLSWAVEYCSQMLDAVCNAVDTKDYGLDSDADYDKYLNKLYELYDIAVKNGAVAQVIEELKSDNVNVTWFTDIRDEDEEFKARESQEELARSVNVGDYVRLYNGNCRYVCSRDGRSLWVTDKESDRTNDNARGWSADLYDIVEILERYDGEEE